VLAELSPEEFGGAAADDVLPGAAAGGGGGVPGEHVEVPPGRLPGHARASAENLREVLPHIKVPTLLVYGDRDVRAPLTVAEHLHVAITGSTLVVLPDARHLCNLEAPEPFNRTVHSFLRGRRS
jgi:pimeloyl-ACP methyl ester carboxylesterase